MNENSLSFRVTSPTQLLSTHEFSSIHINGYLNHDSQDNSIFRSTMDDQFYAPVRKKSIEIFKDHEEDETVQFDILGNLEECDHLERENIELLEQKVQTRKSKGQIEQKNCENPFSKKAKAQAQKQKSKKQIKICLNLENKEKIALKYEKKQKQNAIKIQIINKIRHLSLDNLLVQINLSILEEIFMYFQQQQYFIPFLNREKFDQNCEQSERILNTALQSYFQYINEIYPNQIRKYLLKYNQNKQASIITKHSSLTNISLNKINYLMNTIVKSLSINNSRITTLKKTLLSRVRTLKQMKQHLKQIFGHQSLKQQYKAIQQQQEIVWQNISNIQLLLCLEDSQRYCNQKIKECNGIQKNTWIKHRNIIKKQYARKIAEIEYVCI